MPRTSSLVIFWRLGCLIILTGGMAVLGILFGMANPSLPVAPELQNLQIKISKKLKISSRWREFFRRGHFIPKIPESITKAHLALSEGKWPQNLSTFRLSLRSLKSQLWLIEHAFHSKGCFSEDLLLLWKDMKSTQKTEAFQLWTNVQKRRLRMLIRGTKLLILNAIMLIQDQKVNEGAKLLLFLEDKIFSYATQCSRVPRDVMGLLYLLEYIHKYFIFALVHPDLSKEYQLKIFKALSRWEKKPHFLMAVLFRHIKGFHRLSFYLSKHSKWAWLPRPWNDPKDTRMLLKRYMLRYMFLIKIPLSKPKLWKAYPIENYFEVMRKYPSLKYFRYNALGRYFLLQSRPIYRNLLMIWYKKRCMFAMYRMRWFSTLHKRGIEIPPEAMLSPSRNPFSGKYLKLSTKNSSVCVIPLAFQAGIDAKLIGTEEIIKIPQSPISHHKKRKRRRRRKRRKKNR